MVPVGGPGPEPPAISTSLPPGSATTSASAPIRREASCCWIWRTSLGRLTEPPASMAAPKAGKLRD
jgi:hypothetical protein